jgi:NAD-dependent SIR2 family protein deacetylase
LEPVRASWRENKPIEWERVHDLPEYAYFNHSIHIAKGVGCSTCHGQIDNMPAVYQENTLQMEWCLQCHREPEKYIRPKSEIYNMNWVDGNLTAEERLSLKNDYKIRSQEMLTSCSTCHR